MKKTDLIKIFSILLIVSLILFMSVTSVRAADDDGYEGLLGGNNSSSNSSKNSSNNSSSNSSKNSSNNSSSNSSKNNSNNLSSNNSSSNSSYSNTNLPKTGIESSIPVAVLIVIFGISSVYAYKKINDYRNI